MDISFNCISIIKCNWKSHRCTASHLTYCSSTWTSRREEVGLKPFMKMRPIDKMKTSLNSLSMTYVWEYSKQRWILRSCFAITFKMIKFPYNVTNASTKKVDLEITWKQILPIPSLSITSLSRDLRTIATRGSMGYGFISKNRSWNLIVVLCVLCHVTWRELPSIVMFVANIKSSLWYGELLKLVLKSTIGDYSQSIKEYIAFLPLFESALALWHGRTAKIIPTTISSAAPLRIYCPFYRETVSFWMDLGRSKRPSRNR